MGWIFIVIAGLLEVGVVISLKFAERIFKIETYISFYKLYAAKSLFPFLVPERNSN